MPPERLPMNWDEVQQLLEGLPSEIPILPEKERNNFTRYRNPPSHVYDKGQAWKKCQDVVDKYDGDLCRGYREEIDTLLVFAGLFSAVVTAFTIESYQWLQTDQTDTVVSLLAQIAQSVAVNASAVHLPPDSAGVPHAVSVRVNVYWFLALSLSLSAALVGILGKQWLREFERREPAAPRQAVGVRQNKFDGFRAWRVGEIISTLPLLLQISLALFATGVIELLWQLHSAVAIAVCVPAAAAGLFYLATTLLPVIHYDLLWRRWNRRLADKAPLCPYRSPQALLALRAYTAVLSGCVKLVNALPLFDDNTPVPRVSLDIVSWGQWDQSYTWYKDYWLVLGSQAPRSSFIGLEWLKRNIQQSEVMECIWHCLWEEGLAETDSQARRDIEHLTPMTTHRSDASAQPALRALALSFLTQSGVAPEFAGEALIQNMKSWDIITVTFLLDKFEFRPLSVSADILKSVVLFCRLHIQENIGDLLSTVSPLLLYPKDEAESVLRSCIVYTWMEWIASFHPPNGAPPLRPMPWDLLRFLSEMYVLSPDEGEPRIQSGILETLPHAQELAALIRKCYEARHPQVQCQWPLPEDWTDRFWGVNLGPRTQLIVAELLRISVCGTSHTGLRSGLSDSDDEADTGRLAGPTVREDEADTVTLSDLLGTRFSPPAPSARQPGRAMAMLHARLHGSQPQYNASGLADLTPAGGGTAS